MRIIELKKCLRYKSGLKKLNTISMISVYEFPMNSGRSEICIRNDASDESDAHIRTDNLKAFDFSSQFIL